MSDFSLPKLGLGKEVKKLGLGKEVKKLGLGKEVKKLGLGKEVKLSKESVPKREIGNEEFNEEIKQN